MPEIIDELTELVAIPSVAFAGHDLAQVRRSAEHVASLFEQLGGQVEILSAPTDSGEKGQDAVVAHFDGPAGAPRVLLYAHHDVQPAAGQGGWDQADPFTAERRGERLFGRGTADDKAGVITHAHALRILASLADGELPCSVTVFIEGEEEVGSPSFENFLTTHRDRLASDVIVVADSSNWKVGIPSLTTSLRGVVQVDVRLDMLDHALHSGMYGGPVLDAATAMCRLIASCHDDAGDVAVAGLVSQPQADADFPDYPEADFRADAGILDGSRELGVFGQEAVAGVDGVGAGLKSNRQDLVAVEVGRRCVVSAQGKCLIGLVRVGRGHILIGVDRDRGNAHVGGRAAHAQGDFATVGDEDSINCSHASPWCRERVSKEYLWSGRLRRRF